MFKCLTAQAIRLASRQLVANVSATVRNPVRPQGLWAQARPICLGGASTVFGNRGLCDRSSLMQAYRPQLTVSNQLVQPLREFHAKGSKAKYADFRHKFDTCHIRSHLLIIRRQKMKKHRRRKWRKKFKSIIAKEHLKREIAKEKTYRVELLTMIKEAEQFDPKEYALMKIKEINEKPRELTKQEKYEELKELVRVNRYQVTYIKPKHRRVETYGLDHL